MTESVIGRGLQRWVRRLRLPEWRILILSVGVSTAAAAAVGLLQQRLEASLTRSSAEALGADARVMTREPAPSSWLEAAQREGLRSTMLVEFPSVVTRGERLQLVSVKAVAAGYPLRGSLWLAPAPYAVASSAAQAVPPRGSAYADARLWTALGLAPGADIRLGDSSLRIRAVVAQEPDRGAAFADLQPRLLVNLDDLAATHLLGPGSRVSYDLLLAGEARAIERMHTRLAGLHGVVWQTPRSARPDVTQSVDRAAAFLRLGAVLTALLCAAAVALSAQQLTERLSDEVGLLKALGATRNRIARRLLQDLLWVWGIAVLLAAPLAWAVQALLVARLRAVLQVQPEPADPMVLGGALLQSALLLGGFALPPLWQLRRLTPVQVLQRGSVPLRPRAGLAAALLAVLGVLWLEVHSLRLLGWVALGIAGSTVLLSLLGAALLTGLARLRSRGSAWRLSLRMMARRRAATLLQVVALGTAVLALLLAVAVRQQLLAGWRAQLPPGTPNEFLINIQPTQLAALSAFFTAHGHPGTVLSPMTRGRLLAINGVPIAPSTFADPSVRNWINREFNLSWCERFGDDNRLLQGRWWSAQDRGQPWLSVEKTAAERLHLHVGDRLSLEFAGAAKTLTVLNIREARWDRFQPNFFFVAPPGVLENGPTQWITSLYVAPGQRGLLLELVQRFPNLTPLDIDAALQQVRRIIDEVGDAVAFLFAFALAGGALVMLAMLEATRSQRRRETALLRVLGASRMQLVQGVFMEYAASGAIIGAITAAVAQGVAWGLSRFVFELDFVLDVPLLLITPLAVALVMGLLATLVLLPMTATPPRRILEQTP